jgi:hypothetical protein
MLHSLRNYKLQNSTSFGLPAKRKKEKKGQSRMTAAVILHNIQ